MNHEIVRAVVNGAKVTIVSDCYPSRGPVDYIRVSMTKQTWNGEVTLNRKIYVGITPEKTNEEILQAVRGMEADIEIPWTWKG